MKTIHFYHVLWLGVVVSLFPTAAPGQKTPILFQHVRVFDGTRVIPVADVLIEKGLIKEVGPDLAPGKAKVVDGTGKTLLPGLIDAHVHVHGAGSSSQPIMRL
jgi:imidazolonepropionase-like amidohydrolase